MSITIAIYYDCYEKVYTNIHFRNDSQIHRIIHFELIHEKLCQIKCPTSSHLIAVVMCRPPSLSHVTLTPLGTRITLFVTHIAPLLLLINEYLTHDADTRTF